jgi:hypothetical protein
VYFCFVWHGVGTGKFRREPRCDGHRIFYAGHTNITHVLEWQNYVFVYQKMHQVAPCGRHHLLFKMTLDHYSFFFLFLLGGGGSTNGIRGSGDNKNESETSCWKYEKAFGGFSGVFRDQMICHSAHSISDNCLRCVKLCIRCCLSRKSRRN